MTLENDPLAKQFTEVFNALISDHEQKHQPYVLTQQCPECPDVSIVNITLTKFQAWVLMAQLQLALRHPDNVGPSAEIAQSLALRLQTAVTSGSEVLHEVAERGWNPEHDI